MANFTQDKTTGRLTGSVGAGKNRVPKVASKVPPKVTTSSNVEKETSKLTEVTSRLEKITFGVQKLIDEHIAVYETTHGEVWGQGAICEKCEKPYPCDVRQQLEAILT